MPSIRVRAFLASAALVALPLLAFSPTGTAIAGALPAVADTSAPPEVGPSLPPIVSATPTPDPTSAPTKTAAPSPTATPTHSLSPKPTYSPKPHVTHTQSVTSTASPVTGGVDIGTLSTPTDSATPATLKPASSKSTSGVGIGKLIGLVVGGALLLGVGGVTGLYLTRHHT